MEQIVIVASKTCSHYPLLEQELRFKGVAPEVVRETLDETELDEDAAALELARDRLRRGADSHLEPEVQRRRLAGFLGRRGYDYDVVRRVMKRLFDDEQIED